MRLRVQTIADITTVTHRPADQWQLAILFIAGGAFTVAAALGLANNAAQQSDSTRVVVVFLGGVGVVVGLHLLKQTPASAAEFDRVRGEVRVRRGGAGGTQVEAFPLAEVVAVEVVTSKDGDGDPVYRVAVRRADGVQVLLSPVGERYGPPEVARALASELGLPAPA